MNNRSPFTDAAFLVAVLFHWFAVVLIIFIPIYLLAKFFNWCFQANAQAAAQAAAEKEAIRTARIKELNDSGNNKWHGEFQDSDFI